MITKEINLNRAEGQRLSRKTHTPSTIQADTLFNFTQELRFLIETLKNKRLSPRYNTEDIQYLGIPNLKRIAFPMKCFCDINMHKLAIHLEWYGAYGLAFTKEWGMNQGIQPIHYINPQSHLTKDFTKAFNAARSVKAKGERSVQTKLQSFLIHELLYYKPYEGEAIHPITNESQQKCFSDECEWRYIPDVTNVGFVQIYHNEQIINAGNLKGLSDALATVPEIALSFDYSDIKYIVIEKVEDFNTILDVINDFKLSPKEKQTLVSKIIIWENSKGDF